MSGEAYGQLQPTDHLRTVDTAALVELLDQDGLRATWSARSRLAL